MKISTTPIILFSILTILIFGCVNRTDSTGSAINSPSPLLPPEDAPNPTNPADIIISKIEIGPHEINQPANYAIYAKNIGNSTYFGQAYTVVTIVSQTTSTTNSTPYSQLSLTPGQQKIVMNQTFTPTDAGQYTLTAHIISTNETNINNNTASVQFTINPLPNIYDQLLTNPRITNAIESTEYTDLGENYQELLTTKIQQLESSNTATWNNFRHAQPYTNPELKEVFLQKVAMTLFVEAHSLVPWSILDYSDQDLEQLLGDHYTPPSLGNLYWQMFNNNPTVPFEYANELRELYPEHQINSQKDLLNLIIIKMREDKWKHIPAGFDYSAACNLPPTFSDFECLKQVKMGGSGATPAFIYSILQSQNIPSKQVSFFGHGGILFPSLYLTMDGDAVYTAILGGYKKKPNYIPVDNSFLELSVYDEWNVLNICENNSKYGRKKALQYLNLYNDPNWNLDVIKTYCYKEPGYMNPGDWLFYRLPINSYISSCQTQNLTEPNYFELALTQQEIQEWKSTLAQAISCP